MIITRIAQPDCRLPIVNNDTHFLSKSLCLASINFSSEGRDTRLFLTHVGNMESVWIPVPDHQTGPYGFALGNDDRLYVGFFYGRIYRFDPATRVFDLVAEPFGTKTYRLAWSACGSRAGKIYVGYYPTGEFAEYDTATGNCRIIAPLPDTTTGVYARQFLELPDGRILVKLWGAHSELIIYQPSNGQIEERFAMTHDERNSLLRSALCLLDNKRVIYGSQHAIHTFNFHEGTREEDFLEDTPEAFSWLNSTQGRLMGVGASSGRVFALADNRWHQVETGLHSGNKVTGPIHEIAEETFVCQGDNGQVAKFSLEDGPLAITQIENISCRGLGIHSLEKLPDRPVVVGSHFINSQVFSVDMETGAAHSSLNKVLSDRGQITCSTSYEGVVYLGAYGNAHVLAWNPDEPFVYGENPRELCVVGHAQSRPMGLFHDDSRLYIATRAEYGELGGAISVINPRDGGCEVFRDFVPRQNPCSFFQYRDVFVGTTEIHGDQGSCLPEAANAVIFTWNPVEKKTVFSVSPWPAQSLGALALSAAGQMIGFGASQYYLFDVSQRSLRIGAWEHDAPTSGVFLDEERVLVSIPQTEGGSDIHLLHLANDSVSRVASGSEAWHFFSLLDTGEILATTNGSDIVKVDLA